MSWIQFIRFVQNKTANALHQVANLIDLEANDKRIEVIVHCPLNNAPTHLSEYTAAKDGGGEDEVRRSFNTPKFPYRMTCLSPAFYIVQ